MKKTVTFLMMMLLFAMLSAQSVSVTFTGHLTENDEYVPLSYVTVQNLTRGWAETLRYPDTVLQLTDVTGVQEWQKTSQLALYQNMPNPFCGITDVQLCVAEPGSVAVEITDIFGRVIASKSLQLSQPGVHQLRLSLPTAGTYMMSVRQNNQVASIKMMGSGGSGKGNSIEYIGSAERGDVDFVKGEDNAPKGDRAQHPYLPGDMMLYQGYAFNANNQLMPSAPVQQPLETTPQNITLEFTASSTLSYQPCPGMPTVADHQGNIYTTVLIGNQCWTRENMRCTTSPKGYLQAGGTQVSYFKPYYYVDYSFSAIPLVERGILYNWAGAMDTTSTALITTSFTGRRGICPQGWHVPSKDEWDTLHNYLKGQSGFLCSGDTSFIAKSLASTDYWLADTGTCTVGNDPTVNNATGFTAVPAGFYDGFYTAIVYTGHDAFFWSSTNLMDLGYSAWGFTLHRNWAKPGRGAPAGDGGLSVRCLRD